MDELDSKSVPGIWTAQAQAVPYRWKAAFRMKSVVLRVTPQAIWAPSRVAILGDTAVILRRYFSIAAASIQI
jgi:hypothetical protein